MGVPGKARRRNGLLARKEKQRRMARPAGCMRVHSAVTHLESLIEVEKFNVHRHLPELLSAQLPFLGLIIVKCNPLSYMPQTNS